MPSWVDRARSFLAQTESFAKDQTVERIRQKFQTLKKAVDLRERQHLVPHHKLSERLLERGLERAACSTQKKNLVVHGEHDGHSFDAAVIGALPFHALGGAKELHATIRIDGKKKNAATTIFEGLAIEAAMAAWGDFLGVQVGPQETIIVDEKSSRDSNDAPRLKEIGFITDLASFRPLSRLGRFEASLMDLSVLSAITFQQDGMLVVTELPLALLR